MFCLEHFQKKRQHLLSRNTEGPLTTRSLNALPVPFPALGEGFGSPRNVQRHRTPKAA